MRDPASRGGDALVEGFRSPPASARPRVWWHWMNGNVTKAGIEKDLQWMKRVGIGGLQNFDANLLTPQIVERRLAFMTPEWKDAFRFAATTADQLGLELAIAASPGWSETGGPWVKPTDGMKKLVWTRTDVAGGRRVAQRLPAPPANAGAYHDLPIDHGLAALTGDKPYPRPDHYMDVAVFAYPIPASKPPLVPRISSNGKTLDAKALTDDSLVTAVEIARGTAEKPATVTLEYDAPQTVRSATIFLPKAAESLTAHLEAGVGRGKWRKVSDIVLSAVPSTVSFAPVTARRFRVVLPPKPGGMEWFKPGPGVETAFLAKLFAPPAALSMPQLVLSAEAKVHQFEAKAGFSLLPDYYAVEGPGGAEAPGIEPGQVIDLASRMNAEGLLDWTPPPGQWRIVRLGYSLTGKVNHPATAEATGLEVDKYDARAVRDYLEHYLGLYRDAVGRDLIGARGLQAIITDSVEVGASNWTPELLAHFKRLRGYAAEPFLPALTGAIVGSRQQSDAFLYDYRRTLAELFATEHYGTVAKVAREHGLKVYGEALEGDRPTLGDDMQLRKFADYPMAALWTWPPGGHAREVYVADMKAAASTAHLYGKTAVAAESMTSAVNPWRHGPADLRRVIDLEFALGINRPVIHTSVHQPVDDKQPGLSLLVFGQYFTRHETWAEMARPWIDYVARSSFLLQQGRDVADVAYFHGEEAPLMKIFADAPKRYAYDFVNADAVLNLLKVENGDLVAPSGARYRALYLGGSSVKMTLPMLRKLAALAEAGATIVGRAPQGSPAFGEEGAEYTTLVGKLWSGQQSTVVGQGRVLVSNDPDAALAQLGVPADFGHSGSADSEILFVHRALDDAHIYYINNRRDRPEKIEARFRVAGRVPEIWRADTGSVEPVSYRTEGQSTVVPLELRGEESFFVVFVKPAAAPAATIAAPTFRPALTLEGGWQVAFQPGRGAPASATLESLRSLSEHADPGIKYFSGVATYQKRFTLPAGIRPGAPLMLDLGAVGDLAEVRVNGALVGTVWQAPYRVDVGKALRNGDNNLEIRVANLWVNRLIGDAQPGAKKVTFTTLPTYRADAPLRPSGLIGPVQLLAAP